MMPAKIENRQCIKEERPGDLQAMGKKHHRADVSRCVGRRRRHLRIANRSSHWNLGGFAVYLPVCAAAALSRKAGLPKHLVSGFSF